MVVLSSLDSKSQSPLITNLANRDILSLNGKWNYIVDPYESGFYNYRYQEYINTNGKASTQGAYFNDLEPKDKTDKLEYNFDKSPTLLVPGDWNSQDDKLFWYEGTIWYRRHFDYTKKKPTNRLFIYFGAANYDSYAYLNATKLGHHQGGFTPFNYEITNLIKDKDNSVVVKVDNKRKPEAVPTVITDWFNYGGITRDVNLIEVPETFIRDYSIQLQKSNSHVISGYVKLDGPHKEQSLTVEIKELKINKKLTTGTDGIAHFAIDVKSVDYWSPENPKLYEVVISSAEDTLTDQIGFRTIETKGPQILLNGKPIFLRGISIHEENAMRGGRAYSMEDAGMLLNQAKELNCNFVRLAHYPHNENMVRLADKLGILVWEEIPVYWTIHWNDSTTYQCAENQLSDVIVRDKNRASVIIWSMANETPVSEARTIFLSNLARTARSLDSTRLISAAMEKHTIPGDSITQIVQDPFADRVDVLAFNQYIGWYDGNPDKCNWVDWKIPYDKPVIISEFGGGALAGFHADKETVWSEEFQEELYIQNCKMLDRVPNLCGVTPWILADFRSPRRMLPNIQDGWNRKGLISETGNKKKAFFILQRYYASKIMKP